MEMAVVEMWPFMEVQLYNNYRKSIGKPEFSDHFSNIFIRYKRKGYNIDVIKQSASIH